MDRKLKQLARPDEDALLDAVCSSAHQIWQAGLGAFARAQREGGDLFDKLVQDGGELQKLTQRLTGDKGYSVTDTVTRLAENASRQASGSLDKLESMFEDRVARSLRSLGLPSPEDIQALERKVAELKAALHATETGVRADIDALKRTVGALGDGGRKPKKAAAGPARKTVAATPAKAAAKRPAAKKTVSARTR